MNVKRRQVYYIAGFDHRGDKHYHSLYQNHAQRQSANTPYQISVSEIEPSQIPHQSTWQIEYQEDGQDCHTTYTYLSWDDIALTNMQPVNPAFYVRSWQAFLLALRTGFLKKTKQVAWPVVFSVKASYVSVLIPPLLAVGLLVLMLQGRLSWILGVLLIAALGGFVWWANKKINILWIVHAFNFNVQYSRDESLLDERLTEFASEINRALQSDQFDEVMVVGHCYGSALMIPLLSKLTEQLNAAKPDSVKSKSAKSKTALSILTLAQTSPLISWLPNTDWYKQHFQNIDLSLLKWVDFSSPADGVCYPLLDIFAPFGADKANQLILKSPRFFKLFDKTEYQRIIRKNKFRVHFQYLLSSTFTQEYDFFAMTAGVQTLAQRFAKTASAAVKTVKHIKSSPDAVETVHVK